MPIRPKTVRRLLALAVAGVSISAAIGVTFVHRRNAADARVDASRAAGLAAFEAGDQARAAAELQVYLSARPNDADALMALGQARMRSAPTPGRDDLFEARARFQQVLAIAPDRNDARLALLDVYERLGYAAEQLALADRTLEVAPNDAEALRHRAVALSRLDRRTDAVTAWRRYVAARPDEVLSLVKLVAALRRAQVSPEAIVTEARTFADARPNQPEFGLPLADALHGANRDEEAVGVLRRIAASPPSDPAVIVELVDSLDRCRDFAEADKMLARAAGTIDSSLIRDAFVERLWQSGRFEQVLTTTEPLMAKPNGATPLVVAIRALSLRAVGKEEPAKKLVAELAATKRDPRSAAWSEALAVEFADAPMTPVLRVKALRDSLARDPSNGIVYTWLARSLRAIGETDQAALAYRESAARMPRWATPCVELAALQLEVGQLNDAIAASKAAWSREPNGGASLSIVARVRFAAVESRRDVDEERVLLSLVNSLRTAMPNDASLLPVQIGLQARAGDLTSAAATIDAALAGKPDASTLLALYQSDRRYAIGRSAAIYDAATDLGALTPTLVTLRASDLIDAGDPGAATRLVESIAASRPRVAAWSLAVARTYLRAGDTRAVETWRSLVDTYADDMAVQAAALDEAGAIVDVDRGIATRALDRLRAAMGDTAVEYRVRRARFLLTSKQADEQRQALAMATDLAREVPDRPEVRALLAGQLLASGSHAIAIEHLRAAHDQSPSNVEIALALADAQRRLARTQDADATLLRLATYDFPAPGTRSRVTDALLDAGLTDAAIALLRRTRDVHALDAAGTTTLAELLAERGDPQGGKLFEELTGENARPSATTLAAAAADARRRGNSAAADALLARIDASPNTVAERERSRARFAARFGDIESARQHFTLALADASADANVAREAIAFECSVDDLTRAMDVASTASARFPRDRAIAAAREELEARRGADADPAALARVVELVARDPGRRLESDLLAALDTAKKEERATPELADRFARLSAQYPASLGVAQAAVESCLAGNRPTRAAEIAERWRTSAQAEGLELAARTFARLGRWTDASDVATRWRATAGVEPIEPDAVLAAAAIERGDKSGALARMLPYQPSIDLDAHPAAVSTLARALLLNGQADEAFALVQPRLTSSASARAIWLTLMNDSAPEAAIERSAELLAALPPDAAAERRRLGIACVNLVEKTGSTLAAERGLTALGDANASEPAGNVMLRAELLRSAGRIDEAEKLLRAQLATRPNDAMVQNALAYLLVQQNKPTGREEAVTLARSAAKAAPDQAAILDTLARAEWAVGETAAAEQRFRAAAAMNSQLLDARVGLAQLLGEAGRKEEAAKLVADLRVSVGGDEARMPARLKPTFRLLTERFPATSPSAIERR